VNPIERIAGLSEAEALEAAQLLFTALGLEPGKAPDSSVLTDPLAHRVELDSLARVALSLAALDEDTAPIVDESIDGAGHKQFVLGGGEILAIAGAIAVLIRAIGARGRSKVDEAITFETKNDEVTSVTIHRTVTYGATDKLADLIRALGNRGDGGS
jgi:hypothetical protein